MMNYHYHHPIDQVGVGERVSHLFSRSIKKESKIKALKLVLSMIDLTTLEGKDSPGKVKQLCYKAAQLLISFPIYHPWPLFVSIRRWSQLQKKHLKEQTLMLHL